MGTISVILVANPMSRVILSDFQLGTACCLRDVVPPSGRIVDNALLRSASRAQLGICAVPS